MCRREEKGMGKEVDTHERQASDDDHLWRGVNHLCKDLSDETKHLSVKSGGVVSGDSSVQ